MNDIKSSRLKQLASDIEAGKSGVVEAFWEEVKAAKPPLIEAIEGDERFVLATFLYQGDETITNVILRSPLPAPPSADPNPMDTALTRLKDTNIWYRTEKVLADVIVPYWLTPNDPLIKPEDFEKLSDAEKTEILKKGHSADPLNPPALIMYADPDDPNDFDVPISMFKGPKARPDHAQVSVIDGVPQGKVEQFEIESQCLNNKRKIWVYTPAHYDASTPHHFLLAFDAQVMREFIPTATILDNLIHEGIIPATICVMVGNVNRAEELPPNEHFSTFIREELMAWVKSRYNISANPKHATVTGLSYGGLAASWIAFKNSDIFGNVLSQSGSYWWSRDAVDRTKAVFPAESIEEPGWLMRQYATSERLPIKFYMDVGFLEYRDGGWGMSQRGMNRHMRDVLRAKGYEVTYMEYCGGHDLTWWRQTLVDGLLALREMQEV